MDSNSTTNIIKCESITSSTTGQTICRPKEMQTGMRTLGEMQTGMRTLVESRKKCGQKCGHSNTTGHNVRREDNLDVGDVELNKVMIGNKHDALGDVPVHRKSYAEIVQGGRN